MIEFTSTASTRYALLLFSIVALAAQCGCSNTMSQAESDARDALREMGAFTSLDLDGVHVATIMLTTPNIQSKMDEAMPLVADLPYLTHLDAANTNITDGHMKTIGALKRLTSLVLSGTQVGDEGLRQLAGRDLDTLYVDGTQITSASMDTIGGMTDLKILDISSPNVMSNLSPLANLTSLEWLVLENVEIDAAAVDIIKGIESLGRLTIRGSTVAAEDLTRLRAEKPNLAIDQTPDEVAEEAAESPQEVTPN